MAGARPAIFTGHGQGECCAFPLGQQGDGRRDGVGDHADHGGPTTPASADTGYQIITKTAWLSAGADVRTVVACPTGKVPAGGGLISTEIPASVYISESAPAGLVDGHYSWLVRAHNEDGAAATMTRLQVVCINQPAGYQVVRADKTFTEVETDQVPVFCPPGQVVLGGGALNLE